MKPTLEEANRHFATRQFYQVDALDVLTSREMRWKPGPVVNGTMTLILTYVPNWLHLKGVTDTTMNQVLPKHLQHSQAYREKYL